MKKKIIAIFITVLLMITCTACQETPKSDDCVSGNRFVVVTEDGGNTIYADKDTGVMYFFYKSCNAGGMSVMLDKDGKPLIWKGRQ